MMNHGWLKPQRRFAFSLAISITVHLLVFFAIIDFALSSRQRFMQGIQEVALVSLSQATSPAATSPEQQQKAEPELSPRIEPLNAAEKATAENPSVPLEQRPPPLASPQVSFTESPQENPQDQKTETASTGRTSGGAPSMAEQRSGLFLISRWKKQIKDVVDTQWKKPVEMQRMAPALKATVLLQVSHSGELLHKKLLLSSGNVLFDRSVLLALENIKAFPMPPMEIMADQDHIEITMSFTPPMLQQN